MNKTKRTRYSADFKSKVAREALREESTLAGLRHNLTFIPIR
jgi:transposase-like protein